MVNKKTQQNNRKRNVNLAKYPRQIHNPVIYLKMKLLIKTLNDLKLCTIFAKRSTLYVFQVLSSTLTTTNQTFLTNQKRNVSPIFGTVALTTQPGFYLFIVNNSKTKSTRARYDICLKLTRRSLK